MVLSLLWSCQGAGVAVLGRSPPRGLRLGCVGGSAAACYARGGPRRSLHLPALRQHRRARVRVGAAAALGPGPSLCLLHRRDPRAAARCSRRARPRRIPLLMGTSPLSPRPTRKVRLSPGRAPHVGGRRALRGAVSPGLGRLWPSGGCRRRAAPVRPSRGPRGRGWGAGSVPSLSVSAGLPAPFGAGSSGGLACLGWTPGTRRFF